MEERVGAAVEAPADDRAACAHCGRPIARGAAVGRPRKYCRRSCRQRAYERRRHQGDQAWADRRIIELSRQLAAHEDALDRARWVIEQLARDARDGRPCEPEELARQLADAVRLGEP